MVRKLLVNSDRKILGKADGKIYGITSAIVSGIDGVTENDTQITITTDKQLRVNSNSNIGLTKTNEVTLLPSAITTLKIPYAGAVVNAKNLSPENIAKNIEVLGVTGTYDNGIDGVTEKYGVMTIRENVVSSTVRVYGNKTIESYNTGGSINSFVDCDLKVLTGKLNIIHVNNAGSVIATNLEPQNIKKDVNVLGVVGTLEGGSGIEGVTEQNGYITIGAENTDTDINVYSNKTINIFANVTVKMPTSSGAVSAYNLEPQNIKKGVTILGVTGTYEGE